MATGIHGVSMQVLKEQQNQASWAAEGAEVSFAGTGGDLSGFGLFTDSNSPAGVAEREMLIKQQNRDVVSEPHAFVRYAGGRKEHWCAHFIAWLHWRAGQPLPDWKPPSVEYFPRHAGCHWLWKHLTAYGMVHRGMPRRNDIIFYKNKNPEYTSGHVGLVTEVADGKVTSIEGNLTPSNGADTIAKVTRSLDHSKILGYGRVYRPATWVGPIVGLGAFAITTFLLRKR